MTCERQRNGWPVRGLCSVGVGWLRVAVALCLPAVVTLAGWAPGAQAAGGGGCPNEERRVEQGPTALALPDCRAYELVSPGSTPELPEGLSAGAGAEGDRASVTGEAFAYFSYNPAQGVSNSGYYYLARRGADGWSVEGVMPQNSPQASTQFACEPFVYFSADLSRSVLSDGWNIEEENPGESYCMSSEEQLAPGAPAGYGNLFYREGESGPYSLVNVTPQAVVPANATLQDTSEDLNHILFGEEAQLTGEAPSGYDLYEWAGGTVRLVTFLPDGEPVAGRLVDGAAHDSTASVYEGHLRALAPITHALSADGETVFFYAEHEGSVSLYVRLHAMQPSSAVESHSTKVNGEQCLEAGKACTVEVDRAQGGSGASGGGVFWDASENGERVFFADEQRLTAGAGASSEKPDLYEYDVETGQLTDVTPEALAGKSANARGFSGASSDGSYLYFVAKSALTGSQQNSQGDTAVPREPNLYLYHEGTLTFIATLHGELNEPNQLEEDWEDWQENGVSPIGQPDDGLLRAHVSPDGEYMAFASVNQLTGFDNEDASTHKPDKEIFLYDAVDNQLVCVSCDPGVLPTGPTQLSLPVTFSEKPGRLAYMSRDVLDDGRVFFTSPDALVDGVENRVDNVYEYEDGRVYLLSSGKSDGSSVFYDASPSGRDVFFVTEQSLVAADRENHLSLYDAREGGGFEGEGIETQLPECEPETCRQPIGEPPVEQVAASLTADGPGNPLAPPVGETRSESRRLTRAQQLAGALRACRKQRPKKKRRVCEAKAHKRFGAAKPNAKSNAGQKSGKSVKKGEGR